MGQGLVRYGGSYGSGGSGDSYLGFAAPTTCCLATVGERAIVEGKITAIQAKTTGALNAVSASVWRDTSQAALDGSDFIAQSAVADVLPSDGIRHLATPLACWMGDALGVTYTGSLATRIGFTDRTLYYEQSSRAADGAWANVANHAAPYLQFWGIAAQVVMYGDSISVGRSADASRWQSSLESDFYTANNRNRAYSPGSLLRERLGLESAINAGRGSMSIKWGVENFATRVAPYAAHGALVVANFGVNDLIAENMPLATHQAYWDSLVGLCRALGVRLMRQSILTVRDGYSAYGKNAAQWNVEIAAWNDAMRTFCANRGVLTVDVDRKNGATLAAAGGISGDYIHPNDIGYAAIADCLSQAISPAPVYALPAPEQLALGARFHDVKGTAILTQQNMQDALTIHGYSPVRAVKLDQLDVTVSSRAPASMVDAIRAKTDTIGAGAFTLSAPTLPGGTGVTLYRGDDYSAATQQLVEFTEKTANAWPSLTKAVFRVTLHGDVVAEYLGTVIPGPPQVMRFMFAAGDTSRLRGTAYTFQAIGFVGTEGRTLASGDLYVRP